MYTHQVVNLFLAYTAFVATILTDGHAIIEQQEIRIVIYDLGTFTTAKTLVVSLERMRNVDLVTHQSTCQM